MENKKIIKCTWLLLHGGSTSLINYLQKNNIEIWNKPMLEMDKTIMDEFNKGMSVNSGVFNIINKKRKE